MAYASTRNTHVVSAHDSATLAGAIGCRARGSSFFDGVVANYAPSLPEVLLGVGGLALALGLTTLAIKILPFLPVSLADAEVDPHHASGSPGTAATSAHA